MKRYEETPVGFENSRVEYPVLREETCEKKRNCWFTYGPSVYYPCYLVAAASIRFPIGTMTMITGIIVTGIRNIMGVKGGFIGVRERNRR